MLLAELYFKVRKIMEEKKIKIQSINHGSHHEVGVFLDQMQVKLHFSQTPSASQLVIYTMGRRA